VYLLPAGWEKDPVRMIEAFSSEKVTTAHFIPAMVNSFLDALETEPAETRARLGRTLTRVFAGGEALSRLRLPGLPIFCRRPCLFTAMDRRKRRLMRHFTSVTENRTADERGFRSENPFRVPVCMY
ncbi:hypothetical protein VWP66_22655, partial [Xanthomonas citri pv. citri]